MQYRPQTSLGLNKASNQILDLKTYLPNVGQREINRLNFCNDENKQFFKNFMLYIINNCTERPCSINVYLTTNGTEKDHVNKSKLKQIRQNQM